MNFDDDMRFGRRFLLIAGLLAASGVCLQGYLTLRYGTVKGWSIGYTIWRFFSYFTIHTNILVTVSYLAAAIAPLSRTGRFFARSSVRTGILLYIGIVTAVYFTLLRDFWKPKGLQLLADILMHYVTPACYLAFWILFGRGVRLPWSLALKWLIYPTVYFSFCMLRGSITYFYPYSFLDITQFGYLRVFGNGVLFSLAFLTCGLLLICMSRFPGKPSESSARR